MVKSDKIAKKFGGGRYLGGFTASKIRRLIRRAVIIPADFGGQISGGEFGDRRRLRGLAAMVGRSCTYPV